MEISAAEALARATEAAAGPPPDEAAAEPAEPEPTPPSAGQTEAEPEHHQQAAEPAETEADQRATEPDAATPPEPQEAKAAEHHQQSTERAEPEADQQATEPAEPQDATSAEPDGATAAEPEAAAAEGAAPTAEAGPKVAAEEAAAAQAEATPPADEEGPTANAADDSAQASRPDSPAEPGKAAEAGKAAKAKTSRAPQEPPPDRPELRVVYEAMANRRPLEGRVIGWNNGGFHLALGELAAFCPRSEMETGEVQEPESYLDRTFEFRVLRLQGKGRRIVVSRAAHLRREKARQRSRLRKKLQPGAVLAGTVASLKEFGAFVDLGGAQGLVHVSEISHRRIEHPQEVLSEGQEVRVKVLRVEQGGRRISLSMRALEPDPWKDLADRFPRGAVVKGKVERANQFGAFIELAPGLTGLLPAKSMSIPRETSPARAFPPGKEVAVQIVSVDPRRQRIALALEGSGMEGSRSDFKEYQRQSRQSGEGGGFNALASAFRRLQDDGS